VSTSPAVSSAYKALTNTFTVPNSGLYYVAIQANPNSGNAYYLSWDDLAITIPCDLNVTNVSATTSSAVICAGGNVVLTATGANNYLWSNNATGSMVTVSPAVTTNYNVTGTSTLTGCSGMASQQVSVNPTPVVGIFADKSEVCAGQLVYLTAFGANTYVWSNFATNPTISDTPTITTTYSVIGSNAFNCTDQKSYQVTVNPLPTIAVPSIPQSVCAGESVTLTATGGNTYLWSSVFGAVSMNPLVVSPNTSVTYTVTGTSAKGCEGNATAALLVNPCTGLYDQLAGTAINVYPNPANGVFTVELPTRSVRNIEVTDLTGRKVAVFSSNEEKFSVNLTGFAAGVYYIRVQDGDHSDIVKVIKN
jgi:hypothetical protein